MEKLSASRLILTAIGLLIGGLFLRVLWILPGVSPRRPKTRPSSTRSHTVIVLGSGGHTAEMISLIRTLDPRRHTPRTYVVSAGDALSASKATEFEHILAEQHKLRTPELQEPPAYEIVIVPRAREIHQSLWTAPISCLRCLWVCCTLLYGNKKRPHVDMIITNGPATGFIVILAAQILRFLGLQGDGQMRCIFIESWARVKTLSLSGKILHYSGMVDRFFVQWEALKGPGKEWRGFLVE